MKASQTIRRPWFPAWSAVLWLAGSTLGAASQPGAEFLLGHGRHQLRLNGNGALIAWAGQFERLEDADSAVAGEIRYRDHTLKLENPQVTRTGDRLSFSYPWPAEAGLEVAVGHRVTRDHGALVWTRDVQNTTPKFLLRIVDSGCCGDNLWL